MHPLYTYNIPILSNNQLTLLQSSKEYIHHWPRLLQCTFVYNLVIKKISYHLQFLHPFLYQIKPTFGEMKHFDREQNYIIILQTYTPI